MRTAEPQRRRGFTLIELMLAMALGMVIVFTAFAGIRVAGQCYTISTRLSLENSMLRVGFMQSLDELDFWTSYDNPYDSNMAIGTPNGGEVMRTSGLPFCPFASTFPTKSASTQWPPNGDGTYPATYPYMTETSITGWHPEYCWPMSDPAVWCRMNMGESSNGKGNQSDIRFGFYGNFSGVYGSFPGTNKSIYDYYPSQTVNHQWLSIQMESLKNALGYYGMIEYLPANTIYAYNSFSGSQGVNMDGMSLEMSQSGGQFADGDGGTQFPRGLYRDNKDVAYGIFPANPQIMYQPINQAGAFNGGIQAALRQYFQTGQYTNYNNMLDFQNRTTTNTPLLASGPFSWPGVSTSIERFVTYDRFAAVMRVKLTNAITGQHLEFNFSGFGTSLRGARQQRKMNTAPGGGPSAGQGWASYDNDVGPNTPAQTPGRNDDNLDTQP